jgi:hypothetical protein
MGSTAWGSPVEPKRTISFSCPRRDQFGIRLVDWLIMHPPVRWGPGFGHRRPDRAARPSKQDGRSVTEVGRTGHCAILSRLLVRSGAARAGLPQIWLSRTLCGALRDGGFTLPTALSVRSPTSILPKAQVPHCTSRYQFLRLMTLSGLLRLIA